MKQQMTVLSVRRRQQGHVPRMHDSVSAHPCSGTTRLRRRSHSTSPSGQHTPHEKRHSSPMYSGLAVHCAMGGTQVEWIARHRYSGQRLIAKAPAAAGPLPPSPLPPAPSGCSPRSCPRRQAAAAGCPPAPTGAAERSQTNSRRKRAGEHGALSTATEQRQGAGCCCWQQAGTAMRCC